jgi:hypothetical protein
MAAAEPPALVGQPPVRREAEHGGVEGGVADGAAGAGRPGHHQAEVLLDGAGRLDQRVLAGGLRGIEAPARQPGGHEGAHLLIPRRLGAGPEVDDVGPPVGQQPGPLGELGLPVGVGHQPPVVVAPPQAHGQPRGPLGPQVELVEPPRRRHRPPVSPG